MGDIIKREIVNGYRVTTRWSDDVDGADPREYDNLGTMLCYHRNYNLGHYTDDLRREVESALERASGAVVMRWLKAFHGVSTVLPLYLMDHSGISMSTGDYGDRWDSGQVGIIVDTPDRRKVMGWPENVAELTDKHRQEIRECLESEVKAYSAYIEGAVAYYVVEKPRVWSSAGDSRVEWEEVESCHGFLCIDWDTDYVEQEARNAVPDAPVLVRVGAHEDDDD